MCLDGLQQLRAAERAGGAAAAARGRGPAPPGSVHARALLNKPPLSTASLDDVNLAGALARSSRHKQLVRRLVRSFSLHPDAAYIRNKLLTLSAGHTAQRAALRAAAARKFPVWRSFLRHGGGFSMCLTGLGSKAGVLDEFMASEHTSDGGAVVVRGYAGDTLRHRALLAAAARALAPPGAPSQSRAHQGAAELWAAVDASGAAGRRLYVAIHSIDGPSLRAPEAQALLSQLAARAHVHVIATADHVSFAALWGRKAAASFRWVFDTVHTYEPYRVENPEAPTLLGAKGEAREARGAAAVLKALTPNSRAIFATLCDAVVRQAGEESASKGAAREAARQGRLNAAARSGRRARGARFGGGGPAAAARARAAAAAAAAAAAKPKLNFASAGVTIGKLYGLCRAAFTVSSEQTLKSHLAEFVDHKLVRKGKRRDGATVYTLLFDEAELAQLRVDIDADAAA